MKGCKVEEYKMLTSDYYSPEDKGKVKASYIELPIMARPIRDPIFYGKDAQRFERHMKEKRPESEEDRKKRLEAYRVAMSILEV